MRWDSGSIEAILLSLPFVLQPSSRVEDVNASDWPGHQGEVSIAVDRSEPERVVAASMDLEDGRLLVMASEDSGVTWRRTQIPVSDGAAFHADPMVDFDSRGRAFLAHIPVAAGNHAVGIEVARSDDGGQSWAPSVRISANFDRDDKVALEVDGNEKSPFRDALYVAWKWPRGSVFFSRSLDSGRTFSEPRAIDSARVSGLDMAVGSEGRLYLALYDNRLASIRIYRSSDGGVTFLSSTRIAPVRAGWYSVQPSHCIRQSLTHASIAVRASPSGASGDVLYATWADLARGQDLESCRDWCLPEATCRTEVFFSLSRDYGRSWTEPIAIAEEEAPASDRFFPWVSANDGDGSLYLSYKDTRDVPSRLGTDVYLARSTDCGLSFGPGERLSTASSFATTADFQYGDYQGLDSGPGSAFAAWTDYRSGEKASEIHVGRARFQDRSPGWRASIGTAMVDLSYYFPGAEELLADFYLYTVSRFDGSRSYLTPSGTVREPTSFETRRLVPGGEVTISMRTADLPPGSRLHAVAVPFGADSRAPENAVTSRLVVWVDDLLAGRSAGCPEL